MGRPRTNLANHAAIGTTFLGGTVTSLSYAAGVSRALVAAFTCAKCAGPGSCRLTRLQSGRQASCGCGSKECYRNFLDRRAVAFAAAKAASAMIIWEEVELSDSKGVATVAAKVGLPAPLVSAIWRLMRTRVLAKVSENVQNIAVDTSNKQGFVIAAKRTGLSVAVVRAISRVKAKAAKVAQAARESAQNVSKVADATLRNALDVADGYLTALKSGELFRYRKNEFTPRELPSKSRGTGPAWRAYYVLKALLVPAQAKALADAFFEAVDSTLVSRKRRSDRWNSKAAAARLNNAFTTLAPLTA